MHKEQSCPPSLGWDAELGQVPASSSPEKGAALLFYNHDADGALHWVFGGDYPLLQLRRAVRAGEELCVDYGKGACV